MLSLGRRLGLRRANRRSRPADSAPDTSTTLVRLVAPVTTVTATARDTESGGEHRHEPLVGTAAARRSSHPDHEHGWLRRAVAAADLVVANSG